jgi:DNA-directed RNA polymerase I subunit RPA1
MAYSSVMNQVGSKIINTSLNGLIKGFPENNFTTMTRTGAKGSKVNHSQVNKENIKKKEKKNDNNNIY